MNPTIRLLPPPRDAAGGAGADRRPLRLRPPAHAAGAPSGRPWPARFAFAREPLRRRPATSPRACARCNPSFSDIAAWISRVGAAVALNDLDGDGLPNDALLRRPADRPGDGGAGAGHRRPLRAVRPRRPPRCPTTRATMAPMGCLPGDFNEDGRMDLLVYYWGRHAGRLPAPRRRARPPWRPRPSAPVEAGRRRRDLEHQRR